MSTLGLMHEYKKCSLIYLLWQFWYSHRVEARGFPRGAARWLCILDRTLAETIGISVMICIQAVKATTPRWVHYIGSRSRRGVACLGLGIRLDLTDTAIDPTHPRGWVVIRRRIALWYWRPQINSNLRLMYLRLNVLSRKLILRGWRPSCRISPTTKREAFFLRFRN